METDLESVTMRKSLEIVKHFFKRLCIFLRTWWTYVSLAVYEIISFSFEKAGITKANRSALGTQRSIKDGIYITNGDADQM